jgi:hypothetical protein
MVRAKQKQETQIVTIRFPVALVRKLDRYVKRFGKEFPGISFQRTDAVRLFVERGIAGPMMPEHTTKAETKLRKTVLAGKLKVKGKGKKDIEAPRPAKRKPVDGKKKARKKR